jgi:hypothetical protein
LSSSSSLSPAAAAAAQDQQQQQRGALFSMQLTEWPTKVAVQIWKKNWIADTQVRVAPRPLKYS